MPSGVFFGEWQALKGCSRAFKGRRYVSVGRQNALSVRRNAGVGIHCKSTAVRVPSKASFSSAAGGIKLPTPHPEHRLFCIRCFCFTLFQRRILSFGLQLGQFHSKWFLYVQTCVILDEIASRTNQFLVIPSKYFSNLILLIPPRWSDLPEKLNSLPPRSMAEVKRR